MHETMEKARKLCELQKKTLCWLEGHVDQLSVQDIPMCGEVVDQVKDYCEAEKDLYKAMYYRTIVEAMLDEEDGGGRMGYDHWRTSSGRYAPKGTGHWTPIRGRSGYPMPAEGDWRPEYGPWGDMDSYNQMMGYDNRGGGNRSQGGPDGRMTQGGRMGYNDPDWEEYMRDEKHGTPYKQWKLARKHYTETKADGDKREMTEHAKEHMADTVMTLKEIWMAADPDLRTKMKTDLGALMADMK